MAIQYNLSRITDSGEAHVAPGAVIQAEGQALVRLASAQYLGVQPSTGNVGEIFVGFSMAGTSAAPFPEALTNKVESFVVPTGGTITLARTPISGQVGVFNVTTGSAVSPPSVSGKNITGLPDGAEVVVTYKFSETHIETVARQGDVQPGGYAGAYVGQIGYGRAGLIYTSEYDASKNWRAATSIKLAANGQLTDQTGGGVTISAVIAAIPTSEYGLLGVEFRAL